MPVWMILGYVDIFRLHFNHECFETGSFLVIQGTSITCQSFYHRKPFAGLLCCTADLPVWVNTRKHGLVNFSGYVISITCGFLTAPQTQRNHSCT